MSNDRCTCIHHQKNLAQHHFFKNIKLKDNQSIKQTTEDFVNDKSSHANLLYHRWLSSQPKHIFLKQLGISYISSIHTQDTNSILKLGNKHVYRKTLSNFERIFSPNLRTRQKQEKCFNCACRRVFNKMRLPPGRTAQNSDYLAIARKYRFIFLKNQYVKNSNSNDKKTWKNIKSLSKHLKQPIPPPISTDPIHMTEPYNPIPNMFIPEKYQEIIPKDAIYVNDHFVIPGSREPYEKRMSRICHQNCSEIVQYTYKMSGKCPEL
ncbi:hypothetical protein RhiirA4_487609 [Rhizophagus irregularis]|uniref:DUF8211 domain-containing protein n=1 Tax=Rhizophagus irregularis TaxID=588596 RepID=A0A2I1HSU6_9GLOM|nr:hypothetical protein RhiirA4_487609 [Rhizophagus irregularis]